MSGYVPTVPVQGMYQYMERFNEFWHLYPRKCAKLLAMKAYQKARVVATADEILAGLRKYCAHLPEEARFIAYPASWLNAGRWMDEYDEPAIRPSADDGWFTECAQLHGGRCGGSLKHRNVMLLHRERQG